MSDPSLVSRLVAYFNPKPLYLIVTEAFTTKFVLLLTIVYGFIKGLANQASTQAQLPYYRRTLGISSSTQYQKYYNISFMAFNIKPLVGMISDTFPIFGYHKRYYLLIYCSVSIASLVILAMLEGVESNGPIAAALFFTTLLGVAALDLLCEGKYSEIMAKRKDTGSSIVTWIWTCYMIGGVCAAALEGPIADDANPRIVLWICAPMFLLPLIPSILGWMPETRRAPTITETSSSAERQEEPLLPPDTTQLENKGPMVVAAAAAEGEPEIVGEIPKGATWSSMSFLTLQHKGISLLGILTAAGSLTVVVVSLLSTSNVAVLATVIPIVVILSVLGFIILPRDAAKANLFMFCKEFVYLQIGGPLDYFYTSGPECVADGPNFSFTYYQTFGQVAANAAGILGVFLFEKKLSSQNFQRVFWITTGIKIVAAMFDIVIVQRWNEKVHIPDKFAYMCGDGIIGQVAMMLDFMPVAVLMSRMCPPGREATMYAMLAGFSNFGQSTSRTIGYMLVEYLDIKTSVPCDFSNLPFLVFVGHMVMPLAVIPLSIGLVPNTSMKEVDSKLKAKDLEDPETTEMSGEQVRASTSHVD